MKKTQQVKPTEFERPLVVKVAREALVVLPRCRTGIIEESMATAKPVESS